MAKSSKYKSSSSSPTIHDLPAKERPRERLYHKGAENLSDSELLAIILRTGSKGESVIVLAQKLISKFGSLNNLMSASVDDLKKVRGIGTAKAVELAAVFQIAKRVRLKDSEMMSEHLKKSIVDMPDVAAEVLREHIPDFMKEHFLIACFDTRGRLICVDVVSTGTLTESLVHPREVFNAAIRRHANSIIAAHNHPSGALDPSDEDIKITNRLREAGKMMGIELRDHIIISMTGYYSFKDEGRL